MAHDRSGREEPAVPAGSRVYAVGDIHGCADAFQRLIDELAADAEAAPEPRRVLVCLGDYVDRGPDSQGVIDCAMRLGAPFTETVTLMGNHEAMLLDFLDDPAKGPLWLANGGAATVQAFGVDPFEMGLTGDAWLEALRRRLRAALGTGRLSFLRGLALSHVEGDYLFVHAGVDPRRSIDRQDPHALMWIRDVFLHSTHDFGKVVVHGHTIVETPVVRPNRIGIDTGAVLPGGSLTALVLSGSERRFVSVSGES